ncbi:MAG: hypothetical protein ABIA21_03275 [Candidatus Aenigmatarchaeota archaeon]
MTESLKRIQYFDQRDVCENCNIYENHRKYAECRNREKTFDDGEISCGNCRNLSVGLLDYDEFTRIR